jgi:serine/threonine-protein kinase
MVGLDCCKALDAAHRVGVIHGDLRPNHVVFGADGRLRIVELGLESVVSAAAIDVASTSVERVGFASPERAIGAPLDPRSDVYGLALCLLDAVTGSVPFVGDSAATTLANRVGRLMPVSADLGPLAAVIERAGRPDLETRYTAAEFGRALMNVAEKLPRPGAISLVGDVVAAAPVPVATASPVADPPSVDPASAAEAAGDRRSAVVESLPPPVGDPSGPAPIPARWRDVTASGGIPRPTSDIAAFDDERPLDDAPRRGRAAGVRPSDRTEVATSGAHAPASPPTPPIVAPPPGSERSAADVGWAVSVQEPAVADVPGASSPQPPATPAVSEVTSIVPPPPPVDHPPSLLSEPRSRRTLLFMAVGAAAALSAGGYLAYRFSRDTTQEVPDLVGLDRGEALNLVSGFGWVVSVVDEASETVVADLVIRTDPTVGTRLDEGDRFDIVVSTGPAPRALPELTGLTVDEATSALTSIGLRLEILEQPFDEAVPVGVIIDWMVPDQPGLVAGSSVVRDTVVGVRVSAGPAPRTVPDLANLPLDQVGPALAAQDLVVAQAADEFSPDVPVGLVLRQDPPAGSSVPRGTTVTVVLSKGPDLVAVPPLANLTVEQCAAALEAAGLTVGVVSGNPLGVAVLAEFQGQSLGEGVLLPRGSAIDLTFA